MKKLILSICLVLFCVESQAQVIRTEGVGSKKGVVNFNEVNSIDLQLGIINQDARTIPSAEYGNLKDIRRSQRKNSTYQAQKKRGDAANPIQVKAAMGNNSQGIPPDNDMAISNDGFLISCVNSNIRVFNDTFKPISNVKTLSNLISSLGVYNYTSDPRVIYDPIFDRFILTFFSGALSTESHIFIGFSKTNRPDSTWTFYDLPGNSFNDSTWSDYPILAINDSDVFITFNHVKDNVSWQVGFKQSVIWQIDKQSGYNGASTLPYTLWSNLNLNGVNYRNICPAKPQITPFGKEMYFLSVRNVALSNDSVFLLKINNTQKSGQAQISAQTLISNTAYGFPPNVPSKAGQEMMTNDGRVLCAIATKENIYFGANTWNPKDSNAGVYAGTIKNFSTNPVAQGRIIGEAGREYAYPAICYLGNGSSNDERILYSFSHCYTDSFAGCSMQYKNAQDQLSDIVVLKNGTTLINSLLDSTERWGDYSALQRQYNKPGTAFVANSYAQSFLRTHLARIENAEFALSVPSINSSNDIIAFPNPSTTTVRVEVRIPKRTKVNLGLYNMAGQLLVQLPNDYLNAGNHIITIDVKDLAAGIYLFKGTSEEGTVFQKEILKQ